MKKILIALMTSILLLGSATVAAVEAKGWRLVITDSIENDTKIVVSEIEFLHKASYDVDAVTTGVGGTFAFADEGIGDVEDQFPAGATFTVTGSTGNNGTYTVDSSSYVGGTNVTTVTVVEEVTDATADGTVTTVDWVDGTRGDLGETACGWTRKVPNLTGASGTTTVPCDSVATNRMPDSSINLGEGVRRTRAGKLAFDDITASYFMTADTINATNGDFTIQYTFYTGPAATNRKLPDVQRYTVTVPIDYLGPVDGLAPSNWTVQFMDPNTGRWVNFEGGEVFAANFNNGTDATIGTVTVGKTLTFLLP